MSEEGDFLREFEDEESCDQPAGSGANNNQVGNAFNRQQSKMSEALSHKGGSFYKLPSDVGPVGTPQSAAHIDMHRQESQMSAATNNNNINGGDMRNNNMHNGGGGHTTGKSDNGEFPAMPVSLADLQDDDKSSLESGQVSPEAFDEREEHQPNSAPQNNHRFNHSGGPPPRNNKDQQADKRMGKRRGGRFSRSRSQSPAGFNDGQSGNANQMNNSGGNNSFYGNNQNGGGGQYQGNRNNNFGGGNYGGQGNFNNNDSGRGGFQDRGGHHRDNDHRGGRGRGGYQGRGGFNNRGGGGNHNSFHNNGQQSFNSHHSQSSGGGFNAPNPPNSYNNRQQNNGNGSNQSDQQNQDNAAQLQKISASMQQIETQRNQLQLGLSQTQTQVSQLQQQCNLNPQDQNAQNQLSQHNETRTKVMASLQWLNAQHQNLTQMRQSAMQNQSSNQGGSHGNDNNNSGGGRGGRGGMGGPGDHRGGRGGFNRGRGGDFHSGSNFGGGRGGRGGYNDRRGGHGMDGGSFHHRGGRGGMDRGGHNNSMERGGFGSHHRGGRGGMDRGGHMSNSYNNNDGHRGGGHHGGGMHGGGRGFDNNMRGGHHNNNHRGDHNNEGGHGMNGRNNHSGQHQRHGDNNMGGNGYDRNNSMNRSQSHMNGGGDHRMGGMQMGMNSRGGHGGGHGNRDNNALKTQQPAPSVMNARRYSIYIKNVPQDKFNIVEIDSYFNQFGEVVRIDRHPEKMAATVKFKDIHSAEEAANFAIQMRNPIWGNPQVQLIYSVAGSVPRAGAPGNPMQSLSLHKMHSMPVPEIKPMTEAERLQKQKIDAVKNKIERTRQLVLQKCSAEIQKGLKSLSEPGLSPEQIAQIEQQIEDSKTKMRGIKSAQDKDKQQKLQQVQQARTFQRPQAQVSMTNVKPPGKNPVEVKLVNIAPQLRQFGSILECLKAYSSVSDFRFTDDEKSTAYVKFMAHEESGDALVETIRKALISQEPAPFDVSLMNAESMATTTNANIINPETPENKA